MARSVSPWRAGSSSATAAPASSTTSGGIPPGLDPHSSRTWMRRSRLPRRRHPPRPRAAGPSLDVQGLRDTLRIRPPACCSRRALPQGRARRAAHRAGRDALFERMIAARAAVWPRGARGICARRPRVRVHERARLRHRGMGARPELACAAPAALRSVCGARRAAERPRARSHPAC